VLVFGALTVDFVFPVPKLPCAGETLRSSGGLILAGGKGAIQAIAAARDGSRVSLGGAVGRDRFGDAVVDEIRLEGIDLAGVTRCDAPTGRTSICVLPDGHTAVVTARGANACVQAASISDDALLRSRTLLVQLDTDPLQVAALVLRARRLGVQVILNLSPSRLIDADALRAADVLIGNNEEIAWLGMRLGTASNAASIQAAIGVTTVRIMGVQGVETMSDAGWLHVPTMPVKMHDTTVTGDCFVGVFASTLHRRRSLPEALRRATVAAALSATRVGAMTSIPHRREIDAAMSRSPYPTDQQEEVPG
jgi:ribokinase